MDGVPPGFEASETQVTEVGLAAEARPWIGPNARVMERLALPLPYHCPERGVLGAERGQYAKDVFREYAALKGAHGGFGFRLRQGDFFLGFTIEGIKIAVKILITELFTDQIIRYRFRRRLVFGNGLAALA